MAGLLERVAIVGATGHLGKHFAQALLQGGKHTVTALTRNESSVAPPQGCKVVKVNYENESSLVDALKGHQFLVITLNSRAPPETHGNIVRAASKAGVPYVMPNAYGSDIENIQLGQEDMYGAGALQRSKEIEDLGMTSVPLVCGFWYEWSLTYGEVSFGIDIKNKKAILFDNGNTKINVSTWEQCGRALAGLLGLPESGASPSIADWKNKPVYVRSFRISQRDMLDSIHRVMGTSDKDWQITHESSADRYQAAKETLAKGDRMGFIRAMYTRTFFPGDPGEFESNRPLANHALGLPQEDLDASTKKVVETVQSGASVFGG